MRDFTIRRETPADFARVFEVQSAAFGRPDEARLVEALRERANPVLSLVAESGRELVGHVLFSPVTLDGPGDWPPLAGLAPLGVVPDLHGQGAGSALVRAGLRECVSFGWKAVFLLGDPRYYARFGFVLAAPHGLQYENEAFDRAFQMLELKPGATSGARGWVRYHEAFAEA